MVGEAFEDIGSTETARKRKDSPWGDSGRQGQKGCVRTCSGEGEAASQWVLKNARDGRGR